MNPSGNTTLSRQVLQMVTNTASFYEQNIQTGINSRLRKIKMKHLIFHVDFSSPLFLHVTVWPNLFFWACHGKAAHPANMPDEVWSLHPNSALLPSAHIPALLCLLEVYITHRHSLRVRWRHPYPNLKPVRQTRDQSLPVSQSIFSSELALNCSKVKTDNIVCAMFCIFIVYYLLLHKKIWSTCKINCIYRLL